MNHFGLIAGLQVPEDRSIIEKSEIDHILALLKLRRIDLANLRPLVGELLMAYSNYTLGGWVFQITGLKEALPVT
jgi:hypothetical protein